VNGTLPGIEVDSILKGGLPLGGCREGRAVGEGERDEGARGTTKSHV
jgi:hypothetical protein